MCLTVILHLDFFHHQNYCIFCPICLLFFSIGAFFHGFSMLLAFDWFPLPFYLPLCFTTTSSFTNSLLAWFAVLRIIFLWQCVHLRRYVFFFVGFRRLLLLSAGTTLFICSCKLFKSFKHVFTRRRMSDLHAVIPKHCRENHPGNPKVSSCDHFILYYVIHVLGIVFPCIKKIRNYKLIYSTSRLKM